MAKGQFALALHQVFSIEPRQINAAEPFYSTFGWASCEKVAAAIVRFCQGQGNWAAFVFGDLQVPSSNLSEIHDGLGKLVSAGFLTKDAEGAYNVTSAFINKVYPKFKVK